MFIFGTFRREEVAALAVVILARPVLAAEGVARRLEVATVTVQDKSRQLTVQKDKPRLQREGKRACRFLMLMDFSLQMHSPSSSQMPLVWPRATQLATQGPLPKRHLDNKYCILPLLIQKMNNLRPEANRSCHLGIHKQINACWSIPRFQTVFYHWKICRKWEL